MTIPDKATSLHIKMMFEMPAPDVEFTSAEATVDIQPATEEKKRNE